MRIAIQDGLENVWQAVAKRGWDPVRYVPGQDVAADAVVLTGMDDNLLGDGTTQTGAPVIEASGLSADEVVRRLDRAPSRGR